MELEMIWLGDSLHTPAGPDAAEVFLKASPCVVTTVPWRTGVPGETLHAIGSKRIFTVQYATAHKHSSAK